MKKIIFAILVIVCVLPVVSNAQNTPTAPTINTTATSTPLSVTTQEVQSKVSRHYFSGKAGLPMTDTVYFSKKTQPSTAPLTANQVKFLSGIVVGTGIAADSIVVYQTSSGGGADTLLAILNVTTTTGYITINSAIDSSFVVIKRYKTSDVSAVGRPNY